MTFPVGHPVFPFHLANLDLIGVEHLIVQKLLWELSILPRLPQRIISLSNNNYQYLCATQGTNKTIIFNITDSLRLVTNSSRFCTFINAEVDRENATKTLLHRDGSQTKRSL